MERRRTSEPGWGPFNGRLLCFGEMCKYKNRAKEPTSDEHVWHRGSFLGMCPTSGQYILYDPEKQAIRMARTIALVPDEPKMERGKR